MKPTIIGDNMRNGSATYNIPIFDPIWDSLSPTPECEIYIKWKNMDTTKLHHSSILQMLQESKEHSVQKIFLMIKSPDKYHPDILNFLTSRFDNIFTWFESDFFCSNNQQTLDTLISLFIKNQANRANHLSSSIHVFYQQLRAQAANFKSFYYKNSHSTKPQVILDEYHLYPEPLNTYQITNQSILKILENPFYNSLYFKNKEQIFSNKTEEFLTNILVFKLENDMQKDISKSSIIKKQPIKKF